MARAAPHQAASPWAARQRTAMWAAAGAAALVLVAVVAHVRGGHRAELLQSAAGRVRRMQALSELSGQSVLENEERQAFMNGFRAGEQTAQRDVVEDERSRIEGAKLASLRKALLSQGKAIKQAEEERVALLAQQASREAALKRVDEERVVPSEEEERAMLVSEQAAEEQRAMAIDRKRLQTYEEERAAKLAEEKRAMLVSEKAAEYAQAWQEAAAKQVQAEAMARAEAAFDRRAAAAARLQQKHTEEVGVQAKPGTKRAAELLDFCAQEFGEDPSLQQFCYDKLISKPYGDGAVLDADVQERDGAVLRERVIDAPTIKQALAKARKIGLDNPPKFAELANGELYKVMPLQKALKQHVAQQAQMQQAVSVHPTGHGGVEVDAMSLKKSVEEAHKMGFKGSPEAVVYHPADGKPVVYKLETPQQAQQLSQLERSKPKEIEVDDNTLKGSIAKAHEMGLHGHPEAIVYHEANGKTELYVAQPSSPQKLAAKPQRAAQDPYAQEKAQVKAHHQFIPEVKPTRNGEVEVEAKTLKQSLAEAHKMGFKGQPTAIVYHPAHGKEEVYVLKK